MPIAFRCSCGRALNVKDALAGKKIRCPACQSILAVPDKEIDADDLALEVLPADEEPVRRSASRAAIQVEPPEVLPARRRYDEDDDDPPIKRRPKRRRDIKRRGPSVSFEQGWFGSVNSGVVGGLLMMLIAVVWFIAGLMGGIIFFYPPILFVVGIIAIVKGGLNN